MQFESRRLLAILLLLLGMPLGAEPFVPEDNEQVLLRVAPADDPRRQALEDARDALDADPRNAALATRYARMAIAMGRERDDPRWFGYAQAALAPWWTQDAPPVEVRVLRATLAQNRHAFDAALRDLDAVLAAEPQHVQARLTRAIIHSLQARYDKARRDCAAVLREGALLVLACSANAASLGGDAAATFAALDRALERGGVAPANDAATRLWAMTLRAEIAERLGRDDTASHYRAALAAPGGASDRYLLSAYADWLIDQNRPADALDLLADKGDSDGILLRRAMARQRLVAAGNDSQSSALARDMRRLEARLAAERTRGEQRHLREAAMFALHLQRDAATALWLARENFREQREPLDARVLMAAAIAAQAPAQAAPAVQWYEQHGVEDVRLAPLHAELQRMDSP